MNAYYNHSYNKPAKTREDDGLTFGEFIIALFELILSYIDKAVAVLSSKKARIAFKSVVTAVCLLGFVGIIGGVEMGTISLGVGIIASIMLFTIEILCVRKSEK